MTTGKINKIETMGLLDGPGIRTVVFMQGCPLRCTYCHNPETWDLNSGSDCTEKDLINLIKRYRNYYGKDGGVTFSGGEPLLQSKFLTNVCKELKFLGIHIALDTSGVGLKHPELLDYIDLLILDIKHIDADGFKDITGANNKQFLEFLDLAQKKKLKLWIRHVIIPGINDNEEYILKFKKFISKIKNIEKVELLPYTILGIEKYDELKIDYKLKNIKSMNIKKCIELEKLLNQ